MPRQNRPRRLLGIYDADGSLRGELRYVTLHLLGRAECALCDITHGTLRRKRAMDDVCRRLHDELSVALELVHRDEVDSHVMTAIIGPLPCVVEVDDEVHIVLTRDELTSCTGDVDRFEEALRSWLDGPVDPTR